MVSAEDVFPESHVTLQRRIRDDWRRLLVAGAAAVLVLGTAVKFASEPFHVNRDSALFQHAGWYILEGATLYVDIWDLKPPLVYAVTTLLAFLTGGNMALLHVVSVAVAVAAVTGGVVLTGFTVHSLTDDGFAAVTAGFSMFVLTSVYAFPYAGLRPKYFAFLCAAAALSLAVEDRPLAAGTAAALGAGFWQLGGGVAALVVAMALQRGGVTATVRTVTGGLAVAAVTVLPFVLTGTTIPLFVEVVLAPVYGVERYTVPGRALAFVAELGPGVFLAPVAAYGWWRGVRAEWRTYWWVAAGGTSYLFQLFLEFQGAIELILLFLFFALGVGVLVARARTPSGRSLVAAVVVVLVVTSVYWNASPVTPVRDEVEEARDQFGVSAYENLPADPPGSPSMREIYWSKLQPENCHYRLGDKQKYFETATGGSVEKERCGQWPFDEPPRAWLVDAVVP